MKTDVAVIGTGLTALAAARTVQQSGRQVVLVWPGLSSLYFLFATVDVIGYPTPTAAEPIADPAEAVARLIAQDPSHPYARAGMNAVEASIALMLEWFNEAGLAWEGALDRNFLLPTATGTPKPCCLAPASMTAGDLSRPQPIVLCGFTGYQDFAPEFAAANLKRQWGTADVSALRVTAPGYGPDRLFTSIDLARSFEDADFRDAVAAQLRDRVTGDGVRVGVPGVLGLTTANETFAAFQRAVGHPVFEIATVPPSVIALRLFDRLRKHLQEAGIEIIWAAPAHAAEVTDGRCRSILLKAAGHELPVEAGSYVLALLNNPVAIATTHTPCAIRSFTCRSAGTRCRPIAPPSRCLRPSRSNRLATRSRTAFSRPMRTARRWRGMSFAPAARWRDTIHRGPSREVGWRSPPATVPLKRRSPRDH